ncbi:mycofactocin biosynthesis glycosyltransferase MftF [Microbacterium sp. A93]|uniref:mycofactocin biosynthesis glycosyltransferase MftF n=1 Tax=Microbacterium sp. A93 TaxID=3450716 RepID=UPI003F4251DB
MESSRDWGPPTFPERPERDIGSATSGPLAWTPGTALRARRVALGGSPRRVTVLPSEVRRFALRVRAGRRSGVVAETPQEQNAAIFLLDHGIVDPLPYDRGPVDDVEVVVPVYGDPGPLERCLASLQAEALPVTVVDDASPEPHAGRIASIVERHGARLIRHSVNTGPGGARNTGFTATSAPFVAFIDADALAGPDWVTRLRPLFDDAHLGAVGPRVRPDVRGESAVELYEETRSELDMGAAPSRVVHGVPVGWLPSAAVLVRRSAVTDPPFEPGLRVGEDVDLFWRMDEAGWTVRYVPDVVVHHELRASWRHFTSRRVMYGSSAAFLEMRHPRRLTPASPSWSGLGVLASASTGRPWIAAGIIAYELARTRRLYGPEMPWRVVAEETARSLGSDWFWTGHLLRRDWWPVGWATIALTPRSALARGVAAAMVWEPVRDHILRPTRLDPARSLLMRFLDDASYGTGVIINAISERVPNVITPRPRFPRWPRKTRRR